MKRFQNISPFIVMDILSRARQMEDVIHLEVGEPDLDASSNVIEEFISAIRNGKYKYTTALGLLELREVISNFYLKKYGLSISPERIAITPGTSGAFLVAYSMLMDFGEKIAFSDPSYPCYKNFSYILNIEPLFIPVRKEDNFCTTVDDLKIFSDIKTLQISSPSNPIGNTYDKEKLSLIIQYASDNDISVISDEIYHGLVYDSEEHSALEFDDNVVVINGFSKYFCMPGFRIGWMIMPRNLIRKAEMAIQNVFIAANTPSQYAAVKAFDDDHLFRVKEKFRERRDFFYDALKDIFDIPVKPAGAFYLWADVSKYGLDSFTFTEKLLSSSRVAATPGVDFGKNRTDRYVRFAFTRPMKELQEGVRRIKDFVSSL